MRIRIRPPYLSLLWSAIVASQAAVSLCQKAASGSQQGGAQQTNSAASAPQAAAAPAGITNGTLPIEATILAYKELSADAAQIAVSVNKKTSTSTVLVIGTSSDLAAIVQLRSTLAQAALIQSRLEGLAAALAAVSPIPTYSVVPFQPQASVGTPFIGGPADIATLIQTIGSITAVNENLTSAPGALNDNTLISLIAGQVTAASVFFPSQMPPLVLKNNDLQGTYLWKSLTSLDKARQDLLVQSLTYSQALVDAKLILASKPKAYTDADIHFAGILAENAARINSITDLIAKAITTVDLFESSLLTGQAPAQSSPSASNQNASQNSTTAANAALPTATLAGAAPGATPGVANPSAVNSPAANPPAANPPVSNSPSNQAGSQTAQIQATQPASASSSLQQLLYADLLLHSLLEPPVKIADVKLLVLHALESGGGQLSKSNLFLGSRIYFSGGAIASFTLYDSNSAVICSGIGYGYRGYLRDKNITAALTDGVAPVHVVTNCK